MGKPLGFEAFGLVESIDESGEVRGHLHFALAIKWVSEDGEKPEAIGHEDMVKHLAQFFVLGGGGILLDRAKQFVIRPPLVAHQFFNHRKHGCHSNEGLRILDSHNFNVDLFVTDTRRDPVLQQEQVKKTVEFVADFAQVASAFEAEALEEAEGGSVF